MSVTVRSLAAEYNVPVAKVIEALEEQTGTIILAADMPIVDDNRLKTYRRVISRLAPNPSSDNDNNNGNNNNKSNKVPGKTVKRHIEIPIQELGRDYVIFTYMGLRKPSASEILRQVILIKISKKTKTQIVLCKEAMDQVMVAAQSDDNLKKTVESFQTLEQHRMLEILPGRISEENHSISTYIKKKKLSDSIIIIGFNRSLDAFVFSRNKRNESNKHYVKILQADVTNSGKLIVPDKRNAAFYDAKGRPRCDLSTSPNTLIGGIPGLGENAYYQQKGSLYPVVLEKVLGDGGEAIIYTIFGGTKCAKIFKAGSNSPMKMRKISTMCSRRTSMENIDASIMERIAWPEKCLYNTNGEAIGYIMKLFKDTHCLSEFGYDTFEELIPGVNKFHQITMAVSLTELIDFLHHNNIILCDINKDNVMFDKNQSAYIIDLDSAQFADQNCYYPSNVGFPEFLSPEHIYDHDFSFLHTKADDVWILQMLLWGILTPMGNPYAGSCSDEKLAVAKGLYPYQAGARAADTEIKNTPWHMIVSHWPRSIKEIFWESLHGDGKYFHEADRRGARSWLNTLVAYQEIYPNHIKGDPESAKFMPERYRKYERNPKKADESDMSLNELLKRLSKSGSQNMNWEDID